MDLRPLTIVPIDILIAMPEQIRHSYGDIIHNKGYLSDGINQLAAYMAKQQRQHIGIKYIAMCTPRMFAVYKAEESVIASINLSATVDIFSFLVDTTEYSHVLRRKSTTAIAEAWIAYTSLIYATPIQGTPVCELNTHTTHTRKSAGRSQAIVALAKAVQQNSNKEHDVYFDWLKEYGEDI